MGSPASPSSSPLPAPPGPGRVTRGVWIGAGGAFVVLAALGVVLPLLPTTPFLILAAACFARGSPRLQHWLLGHRVFGPTLRAWRSSRALPPGVKPRAMLVVLLTFGLSMLAVDVPGLRWMLVGLAAVLLVFLARLPVLPVPESPAPSEPHPRR